MLDNKIKPLFFTVFSTGSFVGTILGQLSLSVKSADGELKENAPIRTQSKSSKWNERIVQTSELKEMFQVPNPFAGTDDNCVYLLHETAHIS